MPQSNLVLLYENRVDLDGVAFSGGSWQTGSLGLANLRTPYLAEVARSMSTDPADTQFVCALPQPYSIGGIALGPTNLRPSALVRFRSYLDPGLTTLIDDSGQIALPSGQVDSVTLPWESLGFWEGLTQEFDDIGKGIGKGASFLYVPPARFAATYVKVEIFDQGNLAGYIDIGRLFVSRSWRPPENYDDAGNALEFEPVTDQEEGRSGTRFFNPRAIRRSFKFGFGYLPQAEYREIYQIIVRSGIHNQVFVVPNPADPSTYLREAFFGTLGTPPSLRRMASPNIATEFVVKESL
ncbi:hypothetical protein Q8W71_17710 [Methylobacterium sp. NEAU 140]|uniref:hypothetical protein n=1 Tax=Methylobacterium sp. NEAU 140 TaxID=3064945 RepID=UPI002733B210|nr:hypothetical protein [Methylobacterium sp. NEAU 140]MDP4024465.1 hypothetical protein [Methylobacterium sp. NEAU 140]